VGAIKTAKLAFLSAIGCIWLSTVCADLLVIRSPGAFLRMYFPPSAAAAFRTETFWLCFGELLKSFTAVVTNRYGKISIGSR
jgi:hypothetical protein